MSKKEQKESKEMSVSENAKLAFVEFLQKTFLSKGEMKYFLGGSRRFGYHTEESDFDLFVCVTALIQQRWLEKSLRAIGMEELNHKVVSNYGDTIVSQMSLSGVAHISIIRERDYGECLREHEKIDQLIKKQSNLTAVARVMRKRNIKGSEVYKVLLDLTREEN